MAIDGVDTTLVTLVRKRTISSTNVDERVLRNNIILYLIETCKRVFNAITYIYTE